MKNIWLKFKKIIIAMLALLMIGGGYIGGDLLVETDQEKIEALPVELKLESTTDKIYDTVGEKDLRCDINDPKNCVDYGEIVKYKYISDAVVSTTSITINDGKRNIVVEEDMSKRTANAMFYKTGVENNKDKYLAKIYSGYPFFKDDDGKYYQTETATTTLDAFKLQTADKVSFIGKVLAATNYSSIIPEGYWGNMAVGAGIPWTTLISYMAGKTGTGTDFLSLYVDAWTSSNPNYGYFQTSITSFDTSTIGSGSTISSSSLYLWGTANGATAATAWKTNIATSTNSLTAPILITDMNRNNFGTTYLCDTSISRTALNKTGYNLFKFNSTGNSAINKSGISTFYVAWEQAIDKSATWQSGWQQMQYNSSEYTGTSRDPYLSVEFTTGGGATPTISSGDIIIFE